MEQFLDYFFNQGLLGVITIGEFVIIYFLYRENKTLNQKIIDMAEKRIVDLQTLKDEYFEQINQFKDVYILSFEAVKKLAESILNVVQNLQNTLNSRLK